MCKLQEPNVQQLQQVRMSKPQSSQLIHTIFGSSEESLPTPEQAKMQQLEKRMMEPQVLIQGSNKRPKGKKTKKTVNPKEVTDPPYAGDELRVIPPQPTVPTNLLMPGPSSAGQLTAFPDQLMSLPSYEEMMLDDMFNGPSSMETQPDQAPVKVLEEGVAVTQDGQTVEWWPVEEPEQMANMLE